MILQIALGIVLAVVILALWPVLLECGGLLIALTLVLIGIGLLFGTAQGQSVLSLFLIVGVVWAIIWCLQPAKKK